MDKLNKLWIGLLSGIIIPLGFMYAYIGLRYHGDLAPWALIRQMYERNGITALLAVAAMPNLIAFYFFLNKEYWKAGRGIIFAVMLYGLIVAVLFFQNN